MKLNAILLLITVFACGCSFRHGQFAKKQAGYELVWSDEFNEDGAPDPEKWGFEHGFERNEEHQWYQSDNAWCEKGLLIIEGRRETKPNPNYLEGSKDWKRNRKEINYTASSLITRNKHSWKYGRFIMRGKIDISAGIWPAWWTLGISGRWPANGEIDIMEYYRGQLLANVASRAADGKVKWHTKIVSVDSLGGKQWASEFHIWRMDWDENGIALYVDDILLNKVAMDKAGNDDNNGIHPFKQPHYMLLNMAIGGQQGGDPASTMFPKRFEVDYVRVYQPLKGGNL